MSINNFIEKMKTEEKIFVTDNPILETELKRRVLSAFEPCKKAAQLLKDFGFPLTQENVSDCLSLRKVVKQGTALGAAKWVGETSDRFSKEFEALEVFEGTEHLETELNKILQDVEAGGGRATERTAKAEAIKSEYRKMLSDIYGLFHVGRRTIETADLLHYLVVDSDGVSLPKDIDEQIKADTATYATTALGKKAYKLHNEIAERLNAFADIMKNANRVNFADNIDSLFSYDSNGRIYTSPIDYDLFTN